MSFLLGMKVLPGDSFSVIPLVSRRGEEARKQLLISVAARINSSRMGYKGKML